MSAVLAEVSLDCMVRAVEKVRDRLLRAAAALDAAGVPYAVVGGNAVAAWVSRVDESAVRKHTGRGHPPPPCRPPAAREALARAGFLHRRIASPGRAESLEVFLDGPAAKARDALHILFAGEKSAPTASPPPRRSRNPNPRITSDSSHLKPSSA